jgi:hypothetical protein
MIIFHAAGFSRYAGIDQPTTTFDELVGRKPEAVHAMQSFVLCHLHVCAGGGAARSHLFRRCTRSSIIDPDRVVFMVPAAILLTWMWLVFLGVILVRRRPTVLNAC